MRYHAAIANKQVLFAERDFDTVLEAVKWAQDSGECILHMSPADNGDVEGIAISISGESPLSGKFASIYTGWDWDHYTRRALVEYLEKNI